MQDDTLSTGQAAKLCSVTTDTVLKWIKRGRLHATRTSGGHYRITRAELERCQGLQPKRLHCWEFHREGSKLHPSCRHCIVYRARAARCWELARVGTAAGHALAYCRTTCEECDYYRLMRGQAARVLVLSEDHELATSLHRQPHAASLNVEVAESEYALSALMQTFAPDFVVIDDRIAHERMSGVIRSLLEDSRARLEGIILASDAEDDEGARGEGRLARIGRSFDYDELSACIGRIRAANSR